MSYDASDIKCLEHQTLKVPYEVLNKKFRLAQKNIDREVQKVQAALKDLEKCMSLTEQEKEVEITQALQGVTEKLLIMKRKAEESIHEEIESAKACKRRINHLKEKELGSDDSLVLNCWVRKRLDRMLVEYFLRSGFYDTAVRLAKYSGVEDLTNLDLFLTSRDVEASLINRDTSKCLLWCQDNKSKLRKIKSVLEFGLRQQEFVELLKNGKPIEAIKHAKKNFSAIEDPQYDEIQRCMGLLAFPLNTELPHYKDLLDPKRWLQLVELFRKENYKLYQLNNEAVFIVSLQAGLSALKTPQCYHEKHEARDNQKSTNCPICKPLFNKLAKKLPFAHCSQSKLICSLSNQPMNENNPPYMLPNSHVYGYQSLMEMAAKDEGRVTCLRTGEIFQLKNCEKVFVM